MLTIGRLPVLVPLGPADPAKRRKDIINSLRKLVGNVKDRPAHNTPSFGSSHIRVRQIVLMNNRVPSTRCPDAHYLPSIYAREQKISE